MKHARPVLTLVWFTLLIPSLALAQVSHPASDVTPGNFSVGDYRLPSGVLYVGSALGGLTATDARTTLFDPSGAGKLYVTTTGVGIGTASPGATLDVRGNVLIAGDAEGLLVINDTGTGPQYITLSTAATDSSARVMYRLQRGSALWDLGINTPTNQGDKFIISEGGSNNPRFTIDRTGNVGIGTTSPTQKLDVIGNIKGTQLCIGADCRASWPSDISGGAANKVAYWTGASSLSQNTNFHWDNTNARLGIGTASPSVPLEVQNSGETDLELESTGAGARRWGFVVNPAWRAGSFSIYDATADSARLLVDTNGNVGIGTTNPASLLHLKKDSAPVELRLERTGSGARTWQLSAAGFPTRLTVEDVTGAAERLVIDSTGNVGIGTASPLQKLDVVGNIQLSGGNYRIYGAGANSYLELSNSMGTDLQYTNYARFLGDSGGIHLLTASNAVPVERLTVNTAGNVGIGTTSPANRLFVEDNSASAATYIQQKGLGDIFAVSSGATGFGTERFRITNSGNVGIGTTSPSTKLQVGPNLHASGDGVLVDGVLKLAWGSSVPTPTAGIVNIWHESADGSVRFKFSNGATPFIFDDSGDLSFTGTLTGGSVPWARLTSFPTGCPAGQAVQAIGGTLTCVAVGSGTITGVTAGSGLVGGGTSGDVTLDVGAGNGISVAADSVSINSPACGVGQVSKWTGTTWTCVSDLATGPAGGDLTGTYPNPSIATGKRIAVISGMGGNAGIRVGTGTAFVNPGASYTDAISVTTMPGDASSARLYLPRTGTIRNLQVYRGSPAQWNLVTTIYKNNAATALSITHAINEGAVKLDSDSVSVSAGDYLTLRLSTDSTHDEQEFSWSFEYET